MLAEVFMNVFRPDSLLLCLVGVIMGNIFGCIPGLNTPIAIALCLPFTMALDQVQTVAILMGIYMGGVSGGLVSAILLKIPGTAASVATTFDGYPMTLNGQGTEALMAGVFGSFVGGIFSSVMLLLLAPLLSKLAISFGPWEYFGATLMALSMVIVLIKGNLIKGFISLGLGLLLKSIGPSPVDGVAFRFTFGNMYLENGLNLVALIIGVFALPEIINNASKLSERLKVSKIKRRFFYMLPWKDIIPQTWNMLRSAVIGVVIGILPGLGGGPAGIMAYSTAKKASKTPEKFGKGCIDGVFASETANNATTGGALIPLLSLSVPGDTSTAVILGAFTIQGIAVGPNLSLQQPVLFRTIILATFVANVFMFLYQGSTLRFMSKIIEVPKTYLMPIIVVFCVTGIICLNSNVFDLYYVIVLIILGYAMDKNDYPVIPLIMGVVLGGIVEENLRRSIVYYQGFVNCLTLPSMGTIFFWIAVAIPLIAVFVPYFKKAKASKAS